MGSSFWLFLGLLNVVAALVPPHTSFAFVNGALAVFCFYSFWQARQEEKNDVL